MTHVADQVSAQPGRPPGRTGSDPVLSVRNLQKIYSPGKPDERVAVSDVSFDVAPGEFLCVVGPSGAGKTTLLRCLTGLLSPTSGQALFEGEPLRRVPEQVGVVFQDYSRSLFPWLSVNRNVAAPLRIRGVQRAEIAPRVEEVLHSVGLGDVGRRYPWQLSGGMQQRVAIARALVYRPELLFMDEPFASVDAQTRFGLEDLILRIRAEYDVTVVFVTHDIDEAVYLADRVVVLSGAPSVVREVVPVGLPSPRHQIETKALDEFARLRQHLLQLVMAE
jgi:NitT/TauT family transport system ATP-binding protein